MKIASAPFNCFRGIRSEFETPVRNCTAHNLVEPRFINGTSTCSECFHNLRIFVDARYTIANRYEHGSAYEPNVPGTN
ncbi:MAG TPA: hypothetical protein VFA68_17420, partial [Terriglobales bacterium]|nr:hypothetical protein [Terriglobales bacterium]